MPTSRPGRFLPAGLRRRPRSRWGRVAGVGRPLPADQSSPAIMLSAGKAPVRFRNIAPLPRPLPQPRPASIKRFAAAMAAHRSAQEGGNVPGRKRRILVRCHRGAQERGGHDLRSSGGDPRRGRASEGGRASQTPLGRTRAENDSEAAGPTPATEVGGEALRAAPARKCSPMPCTPGARDAGAPSSSSTAPPSQKSWCLVNCSDTRKAPFTGAHQRRQASWNWRTGARSFWTRSAKCRPRCRPNCSACSKTAPAR